MCQTTGGLMYSGVFYNGIRCVTVMQRLLFFIMCVCFIDAALQIETVQKLRVDMASANKRFHVCITFSMKLFQ